LARFDTLPFGLHHTLVQPPTEAFNDADQRHDFIRPERHFSTGDGAGVKRLLHVLFIDYAHAVGDKVALLKATIGRTHSRAN
jgi:hypothetical protein